MRFRSVCEYRNAKKLSASAESFFAASRSQRSSLRTVLPSSIRPLTIAVSVPKSMSHAQKEALRDYARAMNEPVPEGKSGIFGGKKK